MNRDLPTFKEAEDRVKISHFTKKGYDIRGIVHVGANDGYEVQWYLKMGIEPIFCVEPLSTARNAFDLAYFGISGLTMGTYALGNVDGEAQLNITAGDGKGSSILPLPKQDKQIDIEYVPIRRFATLAAGRVFGDLSRYNCLVVDVQGMELDVLRGMDDYLRAFDFLSIECSDKPLYAGEATASEVIAFLDRMGFEQDSPIPAHDDIMFINRKVLKPPEPPKILLAGNKLNCGSGNRKFDTAQGWINLDISDKDNPDIVADWNDLSMFQDGSMELVVSCHSLEHAGCGQADGFIKEAYRVLKVGGMLLVIVPDPRALAKAYLEGKIDEYIWNVNTYGAWMGNLSDLHRWSYSRDGLGNYLMRLALWRELRPWNGSQIAGANLPGLDWWFYGTECIK